MYNLIVGIQHIPMVDRIPEVGRVVLKRKCVSRAQKASGELKVCYGAAAQRSAYAGSQKIGCSGEVAPQERRVEYGFGSSFLVQRERVHTGVVGVVHVVLHHVQEVWTIDCAGVLVDVAS